MNWNWKKIFSRRKKERVLIDELEAKKLIKITKGSQFCECETCSIKTLGLFGHAVLKSGHHTSFVLHQCLKCGKIGGFPQSNLELALKEGTIETLNELRKAGINVKEYLKTIEKERIRKLNPSKRKQKWD